MTTIETKTFHIGDILSVTTGKLVSPRLMDGVYDILNWLTDDNLMTHQLPRAIRECEGFLRAQFPDLPAEVDLTGLTQDDAPAWFAALEAAHGATREVPRMPHVDHTRIDPITELRMIRPYAEVIVVNVTEEAPNA